MRACVRACVRVRGCVCVRVCVCGAGGGDVAGFASSGCAGAGAAVGGGAGGGIGGGCCPSAHAEERGQLPLQ